MPRGGTTAPDEKISVVLPHCSERNPISFSDFQAQRVSADIRVIAVSLRDSESGITRYERGEVAGVTTSDNGRQSCLIISCSLIGTVPLFN